MKTSDPDPPEETSLRQEAEARLRSGPPSPLDLGSDGDAERLIHELQVHQIELEMQNEELRRTNAEVEAGLHRYTDLFDFAPIGYFNLAADGSILALNLAGARLLGLDRAELSGRRFSALVAQADVGRLNACLEKALSEGNREVCEVRLLRADEATAFVHVEVASVRPPPPPPPLRAPLAARPCVRVRGEARGCLPPGPPASAARAWRRGVDRRALIGVRYRRGVASSRAE